MVILPEQKWIFIHVPRTSGLAISRAIAAAIPSAVVDIGMQHIHSTRYELRRFTDYQYFAVMRSPWDIYASHYGWCLMMRAMPHRVKVMEREQYIDNVLRRGFAGGIQHAMTQRSIAKPPGFWHHYCGYGTKVIQFGPNMHREISELLGVELDVQRVNASVEFEKEWTTELVDDIGEYCSKDIERYAYPPPEVR